VPPALEALSTAAFDATDAASLEYVDAGFE
jgi:hypothetical protein